jgi:glycosyltransferase involved in cell wall biosynthesis
MGPLSVVVPVYQEIRRLPAGLEGLRALRAIWDGPVRAVFVDDGSTDGTAEALAEQLDPGDLLLREPHRGKGGALRAGVAATQDPWVLLCDVDWSVPPREALRLHATGADVAIAVREGPGARRVGEPLWRHLVGRAFNLLVQSTVLGGHADTQCGFKLLRGDVARELFAESTLDGWAIDVELLALAHAKGLEVAEVPVSWRFDPDSRVSLARDGVRTAREVWGVRWRWKVGDYRKRHTSRSSSST